MIVHKDYPEGCAPSEGPFLIKHASGETSVISVGGLGLVMVISIADEMPTPDEAREIAAAIVECADFIDRQKMTTEDKAKDARDGR